MSFGSIASAIGGLIGGHHDREFARAQSVADRNFQREVYQNQYQWKAADAKKAGLHPLAVLGSGTYSGSPSSQPSPSSMAGVLGKMGEGIGDAFTAYMTKDQIAEKAAKEDQRASELHDAQMRESAARTLMYNGQALEATRRAANYTVPMASGSEILKGQVDARSPYMEKLPKYAWPINPDGSHGDPVPSSQLSEAYENAPPPFSYAPFIDAMYDKWRSILTGQPIDGRYHDWRDNKWRRERPPKPSWRFW